MNSFHSEKKKGFTIDPQNYQTNSKGQISIEFDNNGIILKARLLFSAFFCTGQILPPKN